ncbi:hypothetical protein MA16_Dca011747 [Dendrobium catenatum]|uniref:Uncharacterized protein n=1 Tax=Dendrobium catenatum TaxID=906689 RepID=A0A2I0WEF4_9ASPA|nr:hypothetical protein MA16_Dca011747 [Dendrobium catenatum]
MSVRREKQNKNIVVNTNCALLRTLTKTVLQENVLLPSDFFGGPLGAGNGDAVTGGTCATETLRRSFQWLTRRKLIDGEFMGIDRRMVRRSRFPADIPPATLSVRRYVVSGGYFSTVTNRLINDRRSAGKSDRTYDGKRKLCDSEIYLFFAGNMFPAQIVRQQKFPTRDNPAEGFSLEIRRKATISGAFSFIPTDLVRRYKLVFL